MNLLTILVVVLVLVVWAVIGTLYSVMTAMRQSKVKTIGERIIVAPAYLVFGILRIARSLSRR